MYLDKKIAFIGSGFMAGAMMSGIVKGGVCDAENIYVINEAFPESAEEAVKKYGVVHGKPSDIANCDVVVFGVKPQIFPEAVEMYGEYLTADKLYLSIMAGISTGKLESILGGARVVRLMPNMPLFLRSEGLHIVVEANIAGAATEMILRCQKTFLRQFRNAVDTGNIGQLFAFIQSLGWLHAVVDDTFLRAGCLFLFRDAFNDRHRYHLQ